jgi:hypothetical protein
MAKKLVGTLSISGMPLGDTGGGSPDAVLFTPQRLTTPQQAQARTNIGAVSAAEVDKAVETIDLTPYATKVYVENEIAAIDIPEVDLTGYAKETWVINEIEAGKEVSVGVDEPTGEELVWVNPEGDIADKLATEEYVQEQIAAIDIPKPDLTGYATETWVNEKLNSYALKTDIPVIPEIPDVSGFQTEEQVNTLISNALAAINIAEECVY